MPSGRVSLRARAIAVAGLAVTALASLSGPAVPAAAKDAPKKFTAEGEIVLPGMSWATFLGFLVTCPDIPPTQGMSEYIVPIPEEFAQGDSIARVQGSNPVSTWDFDMSFYSHDCTDYVPGVASPAVVPAGTGFISVRNFYDPASKFKLTVQIVPRLRNR